MNITFRVIRELARQQDGKNFSFSAQGTEVPVIQDIADIQFLLKDADKATRKDLPWLSRAIGPGRVTENGAGWELRKELTHRHYTRFDRTRMEDAIREIIGGLPNDPVFVAQHGLVNSPLLYRVVIDLFCRMFFGVTLAQSGLDPALTIKMAYYSAFNSYMPDRNIYTVSAAEREAYLTDLLRDRSALLSQLKALRDLCLPHSPLIRDLASAEQGGKGIVFEQELLTIVSGGADSTSATLGWALSLLGQDSAFQALCARHAAASGSAGQADEDQAPDSDPIAFLIDESLRRFPGFLLLSREATADITISDRTLPAGSKFILNLMGRSHQDLLGSDMSLMDMYSQAEAARATVGPNLAFGGGPRMCGGIAFARAELRLFLIAILQRYRIVPSGNSAGLDDVIWQLSVVPAADFAVTLEPL